MYQLKNGTTISKEQACELIQLMAKDLFIKSQVGNGHQVSDNYARATCVYIDCGDIIIQVD